MSEIESLDNNGNCAICGIDSILKCSGCKIAFYCTIEHQKEHWKVHKLDCKLYKISNSENLGNFVIANRDISANSEIFIEAPLVIGPKWCLDETDANIFPCVGCFAPVQFGGNFCPKCKWPACSQYCKGLTNKKIHGAECLILSTRKCPSEIFETMSSYYDYFRSDALLTLRCILLHHTYPKKWKQIMEFESHDVQRLDTKYYEEAEMRVVSYLKRYYLDPVINADKDMKIKLPDCSKENLHKICGLLEINCLNVPVENSLEISALYPTACLLEHSCLPNCYYTFNTEDEFKIVVRAVRDIKKDEHLSIMYTHILWSTNMRQDHLWMNKCFVCKCERCLDSTELGTYIGAIKCIGLEESETSTCNGNILPINPISSLTDWHCDKCPVEMTNEQVNCLMNNIEDEVYTVLQNPNINVQSITNCIERLERLLHKNHYHMFSLKHSLIQLYGTKDGYKTEEYLNEKITICYDLLKIIDIIDPYSIRLSFYVGVILYELQNGYVGLFKLKSSTDNDEKYRENLLKSVEYLKRARKVLQLNTDIQQGKKFIEAIDVAANNLNELLKI